MDAFERLGAAQIGPGEAARLLQFWRWLVPESLVPFCVTRLGDAFLTDQTQRLWFLDAGRGTLEKVADSSSAWFEKLLDPQQVDLWSGATLVAKLRKAGLELSPGQCYTYRQSPVVGGQYDVSNFKAVAIQQHFDIWGPLLESTRELPEGTRVTFKVVP
jgi:hypothetical protein